MSELGPDARRLVDVARDADDPTAADDARMRRALVARIGVAAGLVAGATATGTAAAGTTTVVGGAVAGLVVKVVAVVAVVGGVSVGAVSVYHARSAATHAPRVNATAQLAPSAPVPASALEASRSAAAAPAPEARPTPGTPSDVAPPVALPSAAPVSRAPARAPAPPPSGSALDEETRLIREADQALRANDAYLALRRLDEHARRFPGGLLAQERDAERVLALCKLGSPDAKRTAAEFLEKNPHSPLADRVRGACSPF